MTDTEITRLLATEIMGWKPWVSPMAPRGSTEPDCWRTRSRRSPTVRMSGWLPLKKIEHAWMVVEAMGKRGFWCRMEGPLFTLPPDVIPRKSPKRVYGVGFGIAHHTGWNGAIRHSAEDDLMPRAICLAALATIEGAK